MTREERHAKDDMIVELRTSGKTFEEISQMTGRRVNFVREVCRDRLGITRVNPEWTDERKAKARIYNQKKKQSEQDLIKKCSSIGYEYAGKYTGSDGVITLKCTKCGTKIERRWNAIRKMLRGDQKTIICPICLENKKAEEKQSKSLEKEIRAQELVQEKEQRFWSQKFNQRSLSFCMNCNALIWDGKKFCSKQCNKAYNNKQKKDRRLRKIKGVKHIYIDIKRLYFRDKGICHLCGGICDFEDYVRDDKGTFIAGNNYPSIDHIIPLSMGGQHTWENVKLAHRICNSYKSDMGARFLTLPCQK